MEHITNKFKQNPYYKIFRPSFLLRYLRLASVGIGFLGFFRRYRCYHFRAHILDVKTGLNMSYICARLGFLTQGLVASRTVQLALGFLGEAWFLCQTGPPVHV